MPTRTGRISVCGAVASGFGPVRQAFRESLLRRGELGGACCAYVGGHKVIDLWGGIADERTGARWREDTVVPVFSTSKGVAALAVALAHSRGLLDYEAPVASYWPEFAQNGKAGVTVRQLLAHQAGLCAIDTPLAPEIIVDHDALDTILARQKPAWEPGSRQGYHCWDLGWYQSALIRRIDPQRRSLGRFLRDEIAAPLGLDLHIGLPREFPGERLARLKSYRWKGELVLHFLKWPWAFTGQFFNPRSLTSRAMLNPAVLSDHRNFNRREVLALEIPSGNGVADARSLAALYDAFLRPRGPLGLAAATIDALAADPIPPTHTSVDEVLRTPMSYSLGLVRPFGKLRFGVSGRAFGFHGAGGSFAYADPDAGVAYAYVTNRMVFNTFDVFDSRDMALRRALYSCLGVST